MSQRKLYGLSPEKAALLDNPTTEGAMKFWSYDLLGEPAAPDAPMAGLHRARVMWPGASKQQVKESKAWLRAHGYTVPPRVHSQ